MSNYVEATKCIIAACFVLVVAKLAYIFGHTHGVKLGVEECQKKSQESFLNYAIAASVCAVAAILAYAVGHAKGAKERRTTNTHSNTYQMSQGDDCAVCLHQVEPLKVLNCGHSFHEACVLQWLNERRTCPLCRTEQSLTD